MGLDAVALSGFDQIAATTGSASNLPTGSERFAAFLAMCALLVAFGVALGLVSEVVLALWRGELVGMRPSPIRSLRPGRGRVVLTGTVEPAWCILKSPFGGWDCVYYSSRVVVSRRLGFSNSWLDEANAVPFILNDGTDKILILARHSRWSLGRPGRPRFADEERAALPFAVLERQFEEAPPCLKSTRIRYDESLARRPTATESVVRVGDVVTVSGLPVQFASTSVEFASASPESAFACRDDGRSLGLEAPLVLAPGGVRGLLITSGSPRQIVRRARLSFLRCLFGAPAALGVGVVVFGFLLPFTVVGR